MYLQSEKIDKLSEALSKAQGEFPPVHKSSSNPFFNSKYASFDAIVAVVTPILSKNSLSFTQFPVSDGDYLGIRTQINHTSGQFMGSSVMLKPNKLGDAQAMGALITYLKRYALSGALGISTDEDNDGNQQPAAAPRAQQPEQSGAPYQMPAPKNPEPLPNRAPPPTIPQSNPSAKWEPKYPRPRGDKALDAPSEGALKFWWILVKQTGFDPQEAKQIMQAMFGYSNLEQFTKGDFWDFEFALRTKSRTELLKQLREFDQQPSDIPPIPHIEEQQEDIPF